MSMLLFTAALLLQVPQASAEVPLSGSFGLPDDVGPALLPYLDCRLLSRGARLGPPGSSQIAPRPEQIGADCSAERASSERQAEQMLSGDSRSEAERRAYIERVLTSIDTFIETIAPPSTADQGRQE